MTIDLDNADHRYLVEWAARYKARFEPEGECGFGRECVGILYVDHYPDWDGYVDNYSRRADWVVDDAAPPADVAAYHKHPCLAVLGRGPDAVAQLARWVRKLDEHGIGIVAVRRDGGPVELLFHGLMRPVLTRVPA
jgi:hypothetical protein